MIIDAFPFYNELDLLEIRLHTLSDVVDKFLLVEAPITHSGKPKSLFYNDNKSRFAEFADKIVHVIVDDMPINPEDIRKSLQSDIRWLQSDYQIGDNWVRERHQRNAIMRGLEEFDDDTIVVISDADEIVRPEILADIEKTICDGSNAVKQDLRSYYLNVACTNMEWFGSKIIRKKFICTPSEVRFHTPASIGIMDGGWHFSWMGGAENINLKLRSYAHQEFCIPELLDLDNISNKIKNRKDVLNRLYEYKVIQLNEHNIPVYVWNNLDKFKSMIYSGR